METKEAGAAPPAVTMVTMSEAERAELLALRADKRRREVLEKAATVIREAGVMLKPEELAQFQESQWAALINLAGAPPRGVVQTDIFDAVSTGQRDETHQPTSPVEVFQAFYEGTL